ncbi:ATP-binding protein [Pseudoalteromonas sp. CO342X]|uniref:ATP-binding protein n=1 Tax=Pseudoalteromonas sp. CO342X TaxID=1777270 RepID=UPI0013EE511C|nr:ATP-binding protein [Pseudoalteromonas sp. CO342X]
MKFKISSGLKDIIGKELIVDDFVAIFELVKNSFDAYADRVDLYFDEDKIYLIDNGKGMSKSDIENKWLFVAYSAKSDKTEDKALSNDYRKNLRATRQSYAGNKGVGRFSCDRLGANLTIQSKSSSETEVNLVTIDWGEFEVDQNMQFQDVLIEHHKERDFSLPEELSGLQFDTGTILEISRLRDPESWDRAKLKKLKASIAKLIDPFGIKKDFDIYIHAPAEKDRDKKELLNNSDVDQDSPYFDIINGKISNLVFERLAAKTTRIKTILSNDCTKITTELIDRGERVYKIEEPSTFKALHSTSLSVELYYMNTVAKINFTRSMGVPVNQFGSVFLFLNGFRVVPIGDPNDDYFQLNARKAQGYARYLGTREVLGLIDVKGDNSKFREASSRDKGLIPTQASTELSEYVFEKALKRLEAYVSKVSWPDKLDSDSADLSRILTDQGKTRVIEVLSKLISGKNIKLLEFSESMIDTISIRDESFESTIRNLQVFAEKSDAENLQDKIDLALNRYNDLKAAEAAAREEAEREKKIRFAAELEAKRARDEKLAAEKERDKASQSLKSAEKKIGIVESALTEEKKRNLFLKQASSVEIDTVRNFHHQIGIYSSNISHYIQHKLDTLNHGEPLSIDDAKSLLEEISFRNQQILTISRIATLADYRMSAESITDDIIEFSKQYLENVASQYHPDIEVSWTTDNTEWVMEFMPLELMIVIDNLVHNAAKPNTGCTKITFASRTTSKDRLEIDIFDDGLGFAEHLQLDIESVFDMGVTTTDGSGLGLYHVRQVINSMGGSIKVDLEYEDGAKFVVRFAR